MPDKQWHLQKQQSNLKARAQLQMATNQFLDWEIITLFYAALQFVDAFFADMVQAQHPRRHGRRKRLVENYLQPIAEDYVKLNKLSENARYERFTPQNSDIEAANRYYQNIENFMQKVVA